MKFNNWAGAVFIIAPLALTFGAITIFRIAQYIDAKWNYPKVMTLASKSVGGVEYTLTQTSEMRNFFAGITRNSITLHRSSNGQSHSFKLHFKASPLQHVSPNASFKRSVIGTGISFYKDGKKALKNTYDIYLFEKHDFQMALESLEAIKTQLTDAVKGDTPRFPWRAKKYNFHVWNCGEDIGEDSYLFSNGGVQFRVFSSLEVRQWTEGNHAVGIIRIGEQYSFEETLSTETRGKIKFNPQTLFQAKNSAQVSFKDFYRLAPK